MDKEERPRDKTIRQRPQHGVVVLGRFLWLRPKSGVARAIAVEVAISLAVELPCSDARKKQGSCGEAW